MAAPLILLNISTRHIGYSSTLALFDDHPEIIQTGSTIGQPDVQVACCGRNRSVWLCIYPCILVCRVLKGNRGSTGRLRKG